MLGISLLYFFFLIDVLLYIVPHNKLIRNVNENTFAFYLDVKSYEVLRPSDKALFTIKEHYRIIEHIVPTNIYVKCQNELTFNQNYYVISAMIKVERKWYKGKYVFDINMLCVYMLK